MACLHARCRVSLISGQKHPGSIFRQSTFKRRFGGAWTAFRLAPAKLSIPVWAVSERLYQFRSCHIPEAAIAKWHFLQENAPCIPAGNGHIRCETRQKTTSQQPLRVRLGVQRACSLLLLSGIRLGPKKRIRHLQDSTACHFHGSQASTGRQPVLGSAARSIHDLPGRIHGRGWSARGIEGSGEGIQGSGLRGAVELWSRSKPGSLYQACA